MVKRYGMGTGNVWTSAVMGLPQPKPRAKAGAQLVGGTSRLRPRGVAQSASGSTGSAVPVTRRGQFAAAVLAASTEEGFNRAVESLLADRYAATTLRTREAWLRTWLAMHELVDERRGETTPPFH